MKENTKWTILLFIIFIIWGSFFPVSKSIISDIHPILLAFLRYFFAIIPMLPFFIRDILNREKEERPGGIDIIKISLLGFLGVTGFAVFLFYGIKLSSSMLSSLLANTQPIFAPLLAPFFTNERVTKRQLIGILIGFIGMSLVVGAGGFGEVGFDSSKLLGNFFCIIAGIVITLYYILIKAPVQKYGSLIPTFISFTAGGVLLIILAFTVGADLKVLAHVTTGDWLLIAYNGIIATAVVYLVHNKAISIIGVIKTIRLKFLIPVFGVLLSIIFLGETAGPFLWIGMVVVIFATVYIQIKD
ncbi:MAG: EamA family transporter [Spirochaetales bacterium]|nr:EamA family transporter [Spirochaetales bacterium]